MCNEPEASMARILDQILHPPPLMITRGVRTLAVANGELSTLE